MAKFKMKMHLSGMSLTLEPRSSYSQVLRVSGVDAELNLEDHLYMDDFSQFETDILHLKHKAGPTTNKTTDDARCDDNKSTSENKEESSAHGLSGDFAHLPDVILAHIFSYLELTDVCRMSRVCRHWRDVAKNPGLWKIVQQTPSNFNDLEAFLNSFIGPSLIFLRPFCMNTNGLSYIKQKCTNIQALWLVDIELTDLDFAFLPSSLVSLAIVPHDYIKGLMSCPPGDWWKDFNQTKFPHLDFLFLNRVHQANEVLTQISELVTLTGLRFENCRTQIVPETLDLMTKKLTNLSFLSLAGCVHSKPNNIIPYVCRNPKLSQIRLDHVWTQDPETDLAALTLLPELKVLHFRNNVNREYALVRLFVDAVSSTVNMFRKLDMLVISGLDKTEAILFYKIVEGMNSESRKQVSFEKVTEVCWRVRVI